jgi:hypothetical protein
MRLGLPGEVGGWRSHTGSPALPYLLQRDADADGDNCVYPA